MSYARRRHLEQHAGSGSRRPAAAEGTPQGVPQVPGAVVPPCRLRHPGRRRGLRHHDVAGLASVTARLQRANPLRCHNHDVIRLSIAIVVALALGYVAFTAGEPPLTNRRRRKHRRH